MAMTEKQKPRKQIRNQNDTGKLKIDEYSWFSQGTLARIDRIMHISNNFERLLCQGGR